MAGSDGPPDEQAETEHVQPEPEQAETEHVQPEPEHVDAEGPRADAEETARPAARRGTAWAILGVVAAALLICCCSAVIGLVVSWSAGLFGTR